MYDDRVRPMAVMRWKDLDATARKRLFDRGVDVIFDPSLVAAIGAIVEDVRVRGDAALLSALAEFDGCTLANADEMWVTEREFEAASAQVSAPLADAMREGIENISAFNRELVSQREWQCEIQPGLVVGERATPIASAGLFVPCGKGSYPSVLMQLATPARVAGVTELTVAVPPIPNSGGVVDPAVLWLARELGIERVFRANGPAGVAAMALGTETVPRARKVLGPGSPGVQAAQIACQLHGCHTQMLLGPTESLVLADDSADPRLLAADLLNEAEHGPDSATVLVTDSESLLEATQEHLTTQLAALPQQRREWALAALGENGGAVLVDTLVEGAEVADFYAPEHLQLVVRDEQAVLPTLHHAGEILIGQHTLFSSANYVLGVPASLPTGGFALVTGGVTAETFLKKTSVAKADAAALRRLTPAALAFAEHEGFPAHAAALHARADVAVDRA